MKLFSKSEVNTARQFEFDFAKAVCILGMVFVHCFEQMPLTASAYTGSLYYTFVIVLDALFGAGTFMICLGIGLTYTKKNKPEDFIKRGLITFALGYALNVFRFVIPSFFYFLGSDIAEMLEYLLECFLFTDIMQFAGLAFFLFGLLKKLKLPDWGLAVVALAMSVAGSFLRFFNVGPVWKNEVLGLFVGTETATVTFPYTAPFPILTWFIFVIFGYFFGKVIRHCENTEKFYAISTPVSAAVIITYMAIAIPNKFGMMCGDDKYYFQTTTLGALLIMMGAVFAFGLYHYVSKLFSQKVKNFITGLSVNINKTYCIHWVIIGWLSVLLWITNADGIPTYVIMLMALGIYVVSSVLAEVVKRRSDKKKRTEHVGHDTI